MISHDTTQSIKLGEKRKDIFHIVSAKKKIVQNKNRAFNKEWNLTCSFFQQAGQNQSDSDSPDRSGY